MGDVTELRPGNIQVQRKRKKRKKHRRTVNVIHFRVSKGKQRLSFEIPFVGGTALLARKSTRRDGAEGTVTTGPVSPERPPFTPGGPFHSPECPSLNHSFGGRWLSSVQVSPTRSGTPLGVGTVAGPSLDVQASLRP